MRSLNIFLLLYFIGNSNYLIINCVPKLVWGCSQAIQLQHINKVFCSILLFRFWLDFVVENIHEAPDKEENAIGVFLDWTITFETGKRHSKHY